MDLLVLPTGPVQCSDDELRAFASEQRFPRWWDPAARSPITRSTLDLDSTLRDARGWPFVALWCEWASEAAIDASVVSGGVRLDPAPLPGGLVGSTIFHVRALPCRPIPLGLIADTLFYAALWSAILFAPLALRTHVRRRRNHCPRCNYDLRATSPGSPCPECGRLTIPRKRV